MPEKSIREMTTAERVHHSLAARVLHSTLLNCVALTVVALIVGLGFFTYDLSKRYVDRAFHAASSAAMVVNREGDSAAVLAEEVMRIYRGLSEEERQQNGTEEYRAKFSHVWESEQFQNLREILGGFLDYSNLFDVYLGMYDRETSVMVYVVDPVAEGMMYPGEWEEVTRTGMIKFLDWDGTGILYDIGKPEKYGWMCTAGVPLQNKAGERVAFVLADVTLGNLLTGMRDFALQFFLVLLVLTALITLLLTRRMEKTVVRPINSIAGAATAYMEDKRKGDLGELRFKNLQIRSGDEIENLSLVLADMENDLMEYIGNLTEVTAEKERIRTELSLAASIQAHMLPSIFPPFPNHPEFDLYASMDPAKEVGGDFYDFFMVDDDHLALVVADVSGKGIPAALFMMIAKTLIKTRTQARKVLSPTQVLLSVNTALRESNEDDMFVTVWLGILRISTGELTYADAGHEKLLLYQNSTWSFVPRCGGVAIGMFDPEEIEAMDEKYRLRDQTLRLGPGDALFQYTDGIPEATNDQEEQFGDERLLAAINAAPSADPARLLPYLRERINEFVQDTPQFDDITMLALRMNGTGEGSKPS